MPRVSVEAHGCIVHCTPQQVQTVVAKLLAGGAGPKASPAEADADGVLLHSASAVKACLEASAVLQLKGSATRSFGTAIRTALLRAYLADQQLLGEPLLRVLGWMSAAADAQRHLTLAMVRQAKERFVELMALFPDTAMSTDMETISGTGGATDVLGLSTLSDADVDKMSDAGLGTWCGDTALAAGLAHSAAVQVDAGSGAPHAAAARRNRLRGGRWQRRRQGAAGRGTGEGSGEAGSISQTTFPDEVVEGSDHSSHRGDAWGVGLVGGLGDAAPAATCTAAPQAALSEPVRNSHMGDAFGVGLVGDLGDAAPAATCTDAPKAASPEPVAFPIAATPATHAAGDAAAAFGTSTRSVAPTVTSAAPTTFKANAAAAPAAVAAATETIGPAVGNVDNLDGDTGSGLGGDFGGSSGGASAASPGALAAPASARTAAATTTAAPADTIAAPAATRDAAAPATTVAARGATVTYGATTEEVTFAAPMASTFTAALATNAAGGALETDGISIASVVNTDGDLSGGFGGGFGGRTGAAATAAPAGWAASATATNAAPASSSSASGAPTWGIDAQCLDDEEWEPVSYTALPKSVMTTSTIAAARERFIEANELNEPATARFRAAAPAVQDWVMQQGRDVINNSRNASAVVLSRIRRHEEELKDGRPRSSPKRPPPPVGRSGGGVVLKKADWNCTSCHGRNFARRSVCFRCDVPRVASDAAGMARSADLHAMRSRRCNARTG